MGADPDMPWARTGRGEGKGKQGALRRRGLWVKSRGGMGLDAVPKVLECGGLKCGPRGAPEWAAKVEAGALCGRGFRRKACWPWAGRDSIAGPCDTDASYATHGEGRGQVPDPFSLTAQSACHSC